MTHPIRRDSLRAAFDKARKAYGPKPSFTQSDVARFLWLLRSQRKSRGEVAKTLRVGEGSVRTMISLLKRDALIDVKRRGCALTRSGAQALSALRVRDARFVPATEFSYGKKAFAVVVAVAEKEKEAKGISWRDAAVKEGADGATMLLFKEGRLELPFASYRVRHSEAEKILRTVNAEEGDAVILGYGATPLASQRGAWAAATTI